MSRGLQLRAPDRREPVCAQGARSRGGGGGPSPPPRALPPGAAAGLQRRAAARRPGGLRPRLRVPPRVLPSARGLELRLRGEVLGAPCTPRPTARPHRRDKRFCR